MHTVVIILIFLHPWDYLCDNLQSFASVFDRIETDDDEQLSYKEFEEFFLGVGKY